MKGLEKNFSVWFNDKGNEELVYLEDFGTIGDAIDFIKEDMEDVEENYTETLIADPNEYIITKNVVIFKGKDIKRLLKKGKKK
jgi:hypothetical protein